MVMIAPCASFTGVVSIYYYRIVIHTTKGESAYVWNLWHRESEKRAYSKCATYRADDGCTTPSGTIRAFCVKMAVGLLALASAAWLSWI
jgi:hypothetical protein